MSSRNRGAVISNPKGTPAGIRPAGTLIAGCPVMFCGSVLYESESSPVLPVESSATPSKLIIWKQFVGVSSTASSPSRRSSSLTYSKRRRRATM